MIQVNDPQPLSKRERARVTRNTLAPFNRAALWPVDSFEYERQYERIKTIQYIVFTCEAIVISLLFLKAAVG